MNYKNVRVIANYVSGCSCNRKELPSGKLYPSKPRILRKKMLREYAELHDIQYLTFNTVDPIAIGLLCEPCSHRLEQMVRLSVTFC